MKRIIVYLLVLTCFAASVFLSCDKERTDDLSYAESVMWSHPDSALQFLKNMDKKELKEIEMKHRYEVLFAQAYARNELPVPNDSALKDAVKYYDEHTGNLHYRMLAHYYLSCHLRLVRRHGEQMMEMLKAEQMAERLHDIRMLRVIHDNKAYLFFNQTILKRAYQEYEKELKDIQALGDSSSVGYAIYKLGVCSESFREEDTERLLREGIALLRKYDKKEYLCEALVRLSRFLLKKGAYDEALKLSREAVIYIRNKKDYYVYNDLGLAYDYNDKRDSAVWCFHQALESPNMSTKGEAYTFLAFVANMRKEYELASKYQEASAKIHETLYWESQQADVVNAEKMFQKQMDEEKHLRVICTFIVLAVCLLSLVIGGVCIYRKKSKARDKDMKRMSDKLESIHENVSNIGELEKDVGKLKKEIVNLKEERLRNIERMIQQSDVMVKISRMVNQDEEMGNKREKMEEGDWIQLQEHINRLFPGFCDTLFDAYQMNSKEVNLCCLLMTNLQPTGLNNVLGCSRSTFYDRQTRILQHRFGITDKDKRLKDVLMEMAQGNNEE